MEKGRNRETKHLIERANVEKEKSYDERWQVTRGKAVVPVPASMSKMHL